MSGLLVLSCVLLWYFSSAGTWLLPSYWTPELLLDLQWWFGAALVLACLACLYRTQARLLLLAAALLYLVHGLGWQASLASLLFVVSGWCLGRSAQLLVFRRSIATGFTATLLPGMALQLAMFGLLLHLPLNHRALYLLLQALPLALLAQPARRHELLQPLLDCRAVERNLLNHIPCIPFAVLLVLLAAVARYALFPTISGDDNALHLRLWTELAWQHEYSFDVRSLAWAVAPFALDLVHAVISLTAGTDARGALNLLLYGLLLRQLWCICGHWQLAPGYRWLLLALFASTPLVANLLITLQTELFMALLATTGLRLLLASDGSWLGGNGLALLAVAAILCATKLPGAVLGLLLLAPALWLWQLPQAHAWQALDRRSRAWLCGFVLACAWVALHSYLVAWLVTGNPLFPLYNGIFRSPWFDPVNFSDGRWIHGFSLESYWNAFFATARHYESRDFVAGFQYLFLLPLGFLLLLCNTPARQAWALGLPLFGFGLVMFGNTQYWRYLFPVMPLAMAALAPLLAEGRQWRWQRRVNAGAMLCCLGLNLWFLPGISYLMAIPPGSVYSESGRSAATLAYLPEKAFSAKVSAMAPGSTVLYQPERPFGAVLHGEPWYPMWYAPSRRDLAAAIRTPAALEQALREQGIDFVVWNLERMGAAASGTDLLRDYLSRHGLPLQESAGVVLSQLSASELQYRSLWQGKAVLTPQPQQLHELAAAGSSALRLSGAFTCSGTAATIAVNLAWSNGTHTWRFISCNEQTVDYREAFARPGDAESARLVLFLQDGTAVAADNLLLELH